MVREWWEVRRGEDMRSGGREGQEVEGGTGRKE